jgi:hypothetical protein
MKHRLFGTDLEESHNLWYDILIKEKERAYVYLRQLYCTCLWGSKSWESP